MSLAKLPDLAPKLSDQPQAICTAATKYLSSLRELQHTYIAGHFDVKPLLRHQAKQVDTIISALFECRLSTQDFSIIALGGYGRQELFPASDIDLFILREVNDPSHDEALRTFIQHLWQLGLTISQYVATLEECLVDIKADTDKLTALLDARLIIGQPSALNTLQARLRQTMSAAEFIAAKRQEQINRDEQQEQMGRLEPDVKIAPGGLRDIHMLGWLAAYCYGSSNLSHLITKGLMSQDEYDELEDCRKHLWRIRFALHLSAKNHHDRLSFDQQKNLAVQFDYQDQPENLAIEQFMRFYYRNSRQIRRINRFVVKMIEIEHQIPQRTRDIDADFICTHNRITLRQLDSLKQHPELLMRTYQHLQNHPEIEGIHPDLARILHRERDHIITQAYRQNSSIRRDFLAILNHHGNVYMQLRRMLRLGLLYRYIPPFWHTVGRMQYDLFHEYSVDQHTMRLLRILDSFKQPQPYYPKAHDIMRTFPEPSTLYLAGLFHDIGKGYHGNHSVIGAQMAQDFASENDTMAPSEIKLLTFLVREHLTLSTTAQKKDLTDPKVITEFAARFPSQRYLDALYLLTMADITATNQSLWNSWRANLLYTLYQLTSRALSDQQPSIAEQVKQAQQHSARLLNIEPQIYQPYWANLPEHFFLNEAPLIIAAKTKHLIQNQYRAAVSQTQHQPKRLFISAPIASDQLFARATHCMERHGFDIVEARFYRSLDDQLAIQQYTLSDHTLLTRESLNALQRDITRKNVLKPLRKRLGRNALQHFDTSTHIRIEQDRQQQRNILHLTCKDRHGLLSIISRFFLEHGILVEHAKITTLGEKVEDIFYFTDVARKTITDAKKLTRLSNHLYQLLDQSRINNES